jgi:hypothetical protein
MISVKSLLNPSAAEPRDTQPQSTPSSPYQPASVSYSGPVSSKALTLRLKMSKEARDPCDTKINGIVNFPPFEDLDEIILEEVRKYGVHQLGQIATRPRHIPYSSEKKNFLGKTGREGFEGAQSATTLV